MTDPDRDLIETLVVVVFVVVLVTQYCLAYL